MGACGAWVPLACLGEWAGRVDAQGQCTKLARNGGGGHPSQRGQGQWAHRSHARPPKHSAARFGTPNGAPRVRRTQAAGPAASKWRRDQRRPISVCAVIGSASAIHPLCPGTRNPSTRFSGAHVARTLPLDVEIIDWKDLRGLLDVWALGRRGTTTRVKTPGWLFGLACIIVTFAGLRERGTRHCILLTSLWDWGIDKQLRVAAQSPPVSRSHQPSHQPRQGRDSPYTYRPYHVPEADLRLR